MNKTTFFSVILLLSLFSCRDQRKDVLGMQLDPEECVVKKYFDNPEEDFGDLHIGMTRAEFDTDNSDLHLFVSNDEVIDSVPLCKNNGAWFENAYHFGNGKLSDIQSTVFLPEDYDAVLVINAIYVQLNERLGSAGSEKGIYTWKQEKEAYVTYIYLSDVSTRFGRSAVQLQYITEGKVSV